MNHSEWRDPSFAQPKPKSKQLCFLSDYRNLNKQLKQKTYPMPKINEMLLKLKGFQYDMSLDLNMGYYNIQVSKNASNLCRIIILWVNYCYKHLPMVVSDYPDIYQQNMNDLFHGFKFIRVYIGETLILSKVYWTDHVQKLLLLPIDCHPCPNVMHIVGWWCSTPYIESKETLDSIPLLVKFATCVLFY